MIILGIETSCDETAVSVVRAEGNIEAPSFEVLGSAIQSQIEIHKEYGGVFPALAKREHAKNIIPVFDEAVTKCRERDNLKFDTIQKLSGEKKEKILEILSREKDLALKLIEYVETHEKPLFDRIAVTVGPGLEPALWVGIKFAEALGEAWGLPVHPTNHMEGHIVSVLFDTNKNDKNQDGKTKKEIENEEVNNNKTKVKFGALALLVSGGHTELILLDGWNKKKKLGETQDDAVGEAFDKVARMLNLPYPGGPEISKLASEARSKEIMLDVRFPRPMINSKDYNFSFSGLKTAVLYYLRDLRNSSANEPCERDGVNTRKNSAEFYPCERAEAISQVSKLAVAREFEDAAIDTLISKTEKAILEFAPHTLIVGGGVIANKYLRECLQNLCHKYPTITLLLPEKELSTDNATMIAGASYIESPTNIFTKKDAPYGAPLLADGNLDID